VPGPLVSVLIPAYNAERYLAEALDSVLAQTWPHLHVVVVDDGSKDATLEVARRYESEKIQVVAQSENRGQTATLNRALREAQGDFIQYFDADDVMDARKIEVQVRRLMDEPGGTVATAAWARFYEDDLGTATFKREHDWRDYEKPIEWLVDDWTGQGTMPPGAWLYPRSVVERTGPWHEDLTLNNDMEYFTRAVLESRKIVFCPGARWYYRSGNESLSGRKDERALRSQFEVIRLSTERMLAVEDSPRTRYACACYWQSFLYMAYPRVPELVQETEERVGLLGGGGREARVSRPFVPLRDVFGWKLAIRLQRLYAKSGAEAAIQRFKRLGFDKELGS
jgi:glycosyltransferase involved in cell wall biosynthesis